MYENINSIIVNLPTWGINQSENLS